MGLLVFLCRFSNKLEIDRRKEQSVRCVGAEAPSTCGAWVRLIFRVSLFGPRTPEVAGFEPVFRASI